jgi:hypothetical protein
MKMKALRLKIYGSDGVELKVGDLVRTTTSINVGFRGGFYTYVKVHQGGIYPFSHFSYARIVKVDKLPDGMLPMSRDKDDPIYKGLPEAWYEPHHEWAPDEQNAEENLTNWKIESMAFEGRGFYRVEEVEVEGEYVAAPNLFTHPA